MEKVINSYETMFIVDLSNGDDAVKATVNKFTGLISSSAELVEVNEWGKRRLAYPINDKNEGYYVVATFKAEAGVPVELDRNYNIDESIMRSMIVKLDFEAVPHAEPVVEETPAETAAEEAAPAEEAPAEEAAAE
ncbi:MAG: 30S ribosomal protein S6 [Ruminococcaceae bacterium]|nr:30S ribosomal protein S6 [Oscillospiraceae bacterium]